jgi:hypothetical protein
MYTKSYLLGGLLNTCVSHVHFTSFEKERNKKKINIKEKKREGKG